MRFIAASRKECPTVVIARGPGMRFNAIFSKRTNFNCAKVPCHDLDTGEWGDFTEGLDDESAKLYRSGHLVATPKKAKALAWSKLQELRRGSQIVSLDLPGMFHVAAEQKISLSGFREEMNQIWIAKKIVFTLSKGGGLRTKIDCETPGASPDVPFAESSTDQGSLFGVTNDDDLPSDSSGAEETLDSVQNGELPQGLPEASADDSGGGFSFDEDGLPAS